MTSVLINVLPTWRSLVEEEEAEINGGEMCIWHGEEKGWGENDVVDVRRDL